MANIFLPYKSGRQPPYPAKLNRGHPLARGLRNLYVTLPNWPWKNCHVTGSAITFDAAMPTFDNRGFVTDGGTTNLVRMPLAASAAAPATFLIVHFKISGSVSWCILDPINANFTGYYGATFLISNANSFDGSISPGNPASLSSYADNGVGLHANNVFTVRGTNDAAGCANGGNVVTDTAFTTPSGTFNTFILGAAVRSLTDNPAVGCTKMFGYWDRGFSNEELVQLSRNPWQLFEPATITRPKFNFQGVAGAPALGRSFGLVVG